MARSRARGRFEAVLGLISVIALGTTVALITGWNPLPGIAAWAERFSERTGELSDPQTRWAQRVGGQPSAAVPAGEAVLVMMRGSVESRDLRDGAVRWRREADWAAVAGDGPSAVAVIGRRGDGMEVVDPATGTARWSDRAVIGAWTYRDAVITLACDESSDCTLAHRAPRDGATKWTATLPGIGRVHAGVNSELRGSRPVSSAYRDALAAVPEPMPPLLGFPIDNRVQVVDTVQGRRLRQENGSNSSRVVVLGGRILVSTAVPRDGNCRYTLEARDAGIGRRVWRKDGFDLGTASGAGCEQRRDPTGGGGVLAAVRGDNREVYLSAADGKELWVGAEGETALATDGRLGAVRSADKTSMKVVDLRTGSTIWQQAVPERVDVAVTRDVVLLSEPNGRTRAFDPSTGRQRLDVKVSGEVLGYSSTGLMLGRGRTIGFLPYTS